MTSNRSLRLSGFHGVGRIGYPAAVTSRSAAGDEPAAWAGPDPALPNIPPSVLVYNNLTYLLTACFMSATSFSCESINPFTLGAMVSASKSAICSWLQRIYITSDPEHMKPPTNQPLADHWVPCMLQRSGKLPQSPSTGFSQTQTHVFAHSFQPTCLHVVNKRPGHPAPGTRPTIRWYRKHLLSLDLLWVTLLTHFFHLSLQFQMFPRRHSVQNFFYCRQPHAKEARC